MHQAQDAQNRQQVLFLGSSDPSTNIPNIAITDRNLEDGKRFALYLQGLLHLPATHASFITPLATKHCSHKILQERCLTRPTPWRWMPLAAELSPRRCMVHLKHVIHSTSLHNKMPSLAAPSCVVETAVGSGSVAASVSAAAGASAGTPGCCFFPLRKCITPGCCFFPLRKCIFSVAATFWVAKLDFLCC